VLLVPLFSLSLSSGIIGNSSGYSPLFHALHSLWIETTNKTIIAGSSLYDTKSLSTAASLAETAVDFLLENWTHEGVFDEYLADQMVIFMALANGRSKVVLGPLSLHTRTAMVVAEKMVGVKFEITEWSGGDGGDEGANGVGKGRVLVEVEGIGLEGRS
jgi:RNA 3'-terminal phosphate cyclase (ATP)